MKRQLLMCLSLALAAFVVAMSLSLVKVSSQSSTVSSHAKLGRE